MQTHGHVIHRDDVGQDGGRGARRRDRARVQVRFALNPFSTTHEDHRLVVTPSRRLFHVLNFPQNDFHVDGLEPPLTLKRVPLSQRRKARFEEADESISPLGGGRLTGRAFQSKTKNVYSDKRTPEQIAEMERDRQPLILRDANDTTFEGTVVSNSVAHYVALSHDVRIAPFFCYNSHPPRTSGQGVCRVPHPKDVQRHRPAPRRAHDHGGDRSSCTLFLCLVYAFLNVHRSTSVTCSRRASR